MNVLPRLLVASLFVPGIARAADLGSIACCADLSEDQMDRVRELNDRLFVYDGCDDTISTCLDRSVPLAERLAAQVCRHVRAGMPDEAVARALDLRARSMMPSPPASIDLAGLPMVGDPTAPVVLVEYACARCPFCAKVTPVLVREIREGSLKGRVRMYFKQFPIKGHPGSAESGLAALAAQDQGRFWEFLLLAYQRFDAFSPTHLPRWAAEVGVTGYDTAVASPELRDRLVASKKEGMANGVKATPTFFISGRMWQGNPTLEMLLDVLDEEYERLVGSR
ncbi:MAG: thioredoxin domain-containing protein [Deltaproteobacteria bacterium]|nr:thioredoxin domain-containing protein [Deltaproteobacteria bacterium]